MNIKMLKKTEYNFLEEGGVGRLEICAKWCILLCNNE
jgi:hypothetical protein